MSNHTFDRTAGDVRRIEVITGVGRRRRWTSEAKARIVAESYSGGLAISEGRNSCSAGVIKPGRNDWR